MTRISAVTAERLALVVLAVAASLLMLVPPIAQPQAYHALADVRSLALGVVVIANAADVLTSLPFTAVGMLGIALVAVVSPAQRVPLGVFFGGLILTGFGSVWYHLAPNDATLVWDRLPMAMAFAGAVGAVAAERMGAAAGKRWLWGWFVLATGSVVVWVFSGDLRLYVIAQFGGVVVLLLWMRLPAAAGMVRLPWGALLVAYLAAKGFEILDREIWSLSGAVVAGHALKHVAAAVGVVPMLWVLRARSHVGNCARSKPAHPAPRDQLRKLP